MESRFKECLCLQPIQHVLTMPFSCCYTLYPSVLALTTSFYQAADQVAFVLDGKTLL